ncbi:hypothetical protein [Streptomyces himalayensis]|uniref:FeoB-associated Cys-rich membrane protein n=1 Tax=Streptomyces himalayensis subsp. himalayensis TaxID=2756131 RepID=A0A7W0DVS9_9ACTN|nr:hypothetical protein [Streptomyces himalayensis]MBA2951643.1 hypothetical protein [Streptomyces himalayensis subsp. himalayensis]
MTATAVIAICIGLIAAGLIARHQIGDIAPAVACDGCTGRPDCPCADGKADPRDCKCPPEGGAW